MSSNDSVWSKIFSFCVILGLLVAVLFGGWLYTQYSQQVENISELKSVNNSLAEESKQLQEIIRQSNMYMLKVTEFMSVSSNVSAVLDTSPYNTEVRKLNEQVAGGELSSEDFIRARNVIVEYIDQINNEYDDAIAKRQAYREDNVRDVESSVPYQALNAVSDGSITMSIGLSPCNSDLAVACVASNDPTHVRVTNKYVDLMNYEEWVMVMTHELAHTVQFKNFSAFKNSDNLEDLFFGDIELHADCMAEAKYGEGYVSGYKNACSPTQLEAGKHAWDAQFN